MTARELIKALQDLGEENLDRDIVMFDVGGWAGTPTRVEILGEEQFSPLRGKIMVD